MFGIGMPELIIILVIALVIIGPSKLPDLAKALGKGMSEFKKATSEIKESLDVEEDFNKAKSDIIDSVSGLEKPPGHEEEESLKSEQPKYENFDEMIHDYETSKSETENREASEPEQSPAREKETNGER